MNVSDNIRGVALATFGIIALSPDSLLIRLIDTDLWTLTFLRSSFMFVSLFIINILIHRDHALQQFRLLDRYAWSIAVILAVSNLFFISAVQTTSVAHVLIIVAAAPVFAALFGLWYLNERPSRHTLITAAVVIFSLGFVVADDQQSTWLGDFYALVACLLWSMIFVLGRKTRVPNMIAAMCLSGLINASWTLPLADLSSISLHQVQLGMLLGFFVGIAMMQITLAPRFIPAAEVAVFMPLEAVFGGFLVWWILGEYPGPVSLIAGMVIILAIMTNSYLQVKRA